MKSQLPCKGGCFPQQSRPCVLAIFARDFFCGGYDKPQYQIKVISILNILNDRYNFENKVLLDFSSSSVRRIQISYVVMSHHEKNLIRHLTEFSRSAKIFLYYRAVGSS